MQKIAVIDIDNTLWDFASVLYDELIKINPNIPHPNDWYKWDFWIDYLDPKTFYEIISKIHKKQDIFGVYPDAKLFLSEIKKSGYKIIIASHREEESRIPTINWLNRNNLSFDELHLSFDKTVLLCSCNIVVDDSPQILQKAAEEGILATGLEFPWNRSNGFKLFKNLSQILAHLYKLRLL